MDHIFGWGPPHLRKSSKLLLFCFAALIAYLAYAAYALERTFGALSSGKAENVERFADLPAIRASLKAQVSVQIDKSNAGLKKNGADIGAMIGAGVLGAFETGLANSMIDALVTPQGVAGLLAGNKSAQQNAGDKDYSALWKHMRLENINTLRFSREKGFVAFFKFDGITWKLVDVQLPLEDILANRMRNSGR